MQDETGNSGSIRPEQSGTTWGTRRTRACAQQPATVVRAHLRVELEVALHVVRRAEQHIDLAAVGLPTRQRRIAELLVGLRDALPERQAGLVFRRARIRVASLDRRGQELNRRIVQAAGEDEKRALIEEKSRISREQRELSPDDWTTQVRRLRADPNN